MVTPGLHAYTFMTAGELRLVRINLSLGARLCAGPGGGHSTESHRGEQEVLFQAKWHLSLGGWGDSDMQCYGWRAGHTWVVAHTAPPGRCGGPDLPNTAQAACAQPRREGIHCGGTGTMGPGT